MQTQMNYGSVNFADGTWGINLNVADDDMAQENVVVDLPKNSKHAQVEVRDFVHSNKQDLVGVVLAVDLENGMLTVYLGNELCVFRDVGSRWIRTAWDAKKGTYAWETVTVLRDE
jgi:hypothetical protein